jgi:hypothetical protein
MSPLGCEGRLGFSGAARAEVVVIGRTACAGRGFLRNGIQWRNLARVWASSLRMVNATALNATYSSFSACITSTFAARSA